MKVRFEQKRDPNRSRGMHVPYGAARRQLPRLRWLLIVLFVTSPILYFGWTVARDSLVVEAPALLELDTVEVGTMVSGVVRSVPVEVGDPVSAGSRLAVLENPELDGRVHSLRAARERIEAERRRHRERAEQRLAAIEEEIASLQQLRAAQRSWLQEVQRLNDAGAATARERLQAQTRLRATSRERIEALQRRADAERAVAEGDAGLRQRRREISLDLELARDAQNFLTVASDGAGRVADVSVTPGDTVGPGATLVTLVRDTAPTLTAYLRPSRAAFARQGAAVEVTLPNGTQLPGRVTEAPRLTRTIPPAIRSTLGSDNARLLVRITLDEALPVDMTVHRLPASVQFASGARVLLQGDHLP